MTPAESAKELEERLIEISGWPVLVEPSNEIPGYATLRMASEATPVHYFRYKPEFSSDLPYLQAFQYTLALRTLEADPENRFDVMSSQALATELPRMVGTHLREHHLKFHESMIPPLCSQFANGLGVQVRTLPVTIRVERTILEQYPSLGALQRKNNERHLQESMAALGADIRAIAPPKVFHANVSMSAAFAKFLGREWNEPHLATAFVSAGYEKIADELLAIADTIDSSPNGDRLLVEAWAEKVGISNWYVTVPKS